MISTKRAADDVAPTWHERAFVCAGYLCMVFFPVWIFAPLLLYFWKSRTSRFIAFHTVQAILLAHALWFAYCALAVVFSGLNNVLPRSIRDLEFWITTFAYVAVPLIADILMTLAVARGRPAVLPVLGPISEQVITASDGVAPPDDRVMAGAAYLLSMFPCVWPLGPLLLYFWKRRQSRFVAFHAVQTILLDIALIPLMVSMFFGLPLAILTYVDRKGPTMGAIGSVVAMSGSAAGVFLMYLVNTWMGIAVMRGRPGVVPLLGRVARRIAGDWREGT